MRVRCRQKGYDFPPKRFVGSFNFGRVRAKGDGTTRLFPCLDGKKKKILNHCLKSSKMK